VVADAQLIGLLQDAMGGQSGQVSALPLSSR
jgi:hypothetical protein